MPTFLGYPYDPELFDYNWSQVKDPTLTAMFESGAVVQDSEIANLISKGSNTYTLPFHNVLGGTEDNYDGQTNITATVPDGGAQSGIVYGRAHGWTEKDFVRDFNSGADPMHQIVTQVDKYWQKRRQERMIGILGAVFGISSTDWNKHKTDISSANTTVASTNQIGPATFNDAITDALGDNRGMFSLAIMHSQVASALEKLNLLQFRTYTDANGMTRKLNIADCNGLAVIVDDGAPVTAATSSVAAKYTTYLLGNGVLRFAKAPVDRPSELERSAATNGGQTTLYTRLRETIHPYGFSFTMPSAATSVSPTNAQLFATANWSIPTGIDVKNIPMAQIISNV